MNIKFPLFLTFLSGLSTLLGCLILFAKKDKKIIIASLAFASGVMLTVSFIDLIKESFLYLYSVFHFIPSCLYLLLFLFIGFIIALLISKILPDNGLYRVGIYSMLAIMFHNIPEGIITYLTTTNNIQLGMKLTSAIALHNIPEGISIAVPIYYAKRSKFKAFLYTLVSALSEPLGAMIAYMFIPNLNNRLMGILLAITAGIMIYISICELLPESIRYNNKSITWIYFIIGCLIMIISNLII